VRLRRPSAALVGTFSVHKRGASTVEKLITSVHESVRFVDRPVDKKIVRFSFLDSVAGTSARL
jgi:hypothetical protein